MTPVFCVIFIKISHSELLTFKDVNFFPFIMIFEKIILKIMKNFSTHEMKVGEILLFANTLLIRSYPDILLRAFLLANY